MHELNYALIVNGSLVDDLPTVCYQELTVAAGATETVAMPVPGFINPRI